ncbi:MAG: hypothetical protein ABIH70_02610 [Chloroflexota bacterium]
MQELNYWIATVMIAISGIALNLYYNGRVLEAPEKKQEIGNRMKWAGLIWFFIVSLIFIIFMIINC